MSDKLTGPEIASRLRELSEIHAIPELSSLAAQMRRRPPVRKAEPTSAPMTDELAVSIKAYAKANPGLSFTAIGRIFTVNIGRVSEVLNGDR